MQHLKIVVLGDSIAEGLGVKGRCYADLLRMHLGKADCPVSLLNLAYTAFQITDSRKYWPQVIAFDPDIVIIAHGITEAIIRPNINGYRIGRLDPRPYYSQQLLKRLCQQFDSALRWRFQVWMIQKDGGRTLMSCDEFESRLTESLDSLLRETSARVTLLTHNGIDERFYSNSLASLNCFQECIARVAAQAALPNRVQVCDISHLLDPWSDFFADHFHPNATGHAKIAAALFEKVAR